MKFYKWFYNFLVGVFVTYGKLMILWIILFSITKKPDINFKNILFLLEIVAIPWAINFIFHFNSSLVVKGTLHSIIWLMLSIIIYGAMYSVALEAKLLITIIIAFFILYGILLTTTSYCSKKINTPLRHSAEFLFKFANLFLK